MHQQKNKKAPQNQKQKKIDKALGSNGIKFYRF